ncbi:Histidine biosynthesis bifunctional protein hisB [Knufia obscura]|uniref:Imidazole glycerol phosphate synthase hisHF n=2 Tax=Knufia TaxID=430999 RepID=A0AAN8I823_9EURO|nr:Histidine biosynthesis bifunctional protein hisB [Knufia obscura]KAK5956809.1 Histidine biosynthesis bifunctional protein hisB [Knufia fluminis]
MPTVHLLDYVAGNIRSLVNAIEKCGYEVAWIRSPEEVASADKIILPGVGHFGHCLNSLAKANYLPAIHEHIKAGKPFFGICVGLQALFAGSVEAPDAAGLGVLPQTLQRFNPKNADGSKKSIPCIGWNSATTIHDTASTGAGTESSTKSFYGLNPDSKYYYVHSYFAPYTRHDLETQGWTVATAQYGDQTYIGAIGRDNIFATQFHPEKSGAAGLRVIKAFLDGKQWSTPAPPDNLTAATSTNSHASGLNNLTRRIIACLDVRTNDAGDLVVTKGDQYDVREKTDDKSVRNLGKPVEMAKKYYTQSTDEVTFLNITSFRDCPVTDLPMLEILRQTSKSVFVPLTIGGGIRDMVDPGTGKTISALDVAKLYFESGADKVSIGSDAVVAAQEFWKRGGKGDGKTGIETISAAYGRQAVVVSVDPRRVFVKTPEDVPAGVDTSHVLKTRLPNAEGWEYVYYACTVHGGRTTTDLTVRALVTAVEALGAGEILLNAIDRDGSNSGYDLELINDVKNAVEIPVIASSGAGNPGHFVEVFRETGVDAALGAGMFHRGEYEVNQVKEELARQGYLVRRWEGEEL